MEHQLGQVLTLLTSIKESLIEHNPARLAERVSALEQWQARRGGLAQTLLGLVGGLITAGGAIIVALLTGWLTLRGGG